MTRSLTELDQRGQRLIDDGEVVRGDLPEHTQTAFRRAADRVQKGQHFSHQIHVRPKVLIAKEVLKKYFELFLNTVFEKSLTRIFF